MSGTWNYPTDFKNYEQFQFQSILESPLGWKTILKDPVPEIVSVMKGYKSAYLILTRSQEIHVDLTHDMPSGSVDQIEKLVSQSSEFKLIYANPDAVIFTLSSNSSVPSVPSAAPVIPSVPNTPLPSMPQPTPTDIPTPTLAPSDTPVPTLVPTLAPAPTEAPPANSGPPAPKSPPGRRKKGGG